MADKLIDVEILKKGQALLEQWRAASRGTNLEALQGAADAWTDWASLYAGDIMLALKAYSALEAILDHTHITELIWWTVPGVWGLKTQVDQTGEDEGEWQADELDEVLCEAAADFAAADEMDAEEAAAVRPPVKRCCKCRAVIAEPQCKSDERCDACADDAVGEVSHG